MDISSGFGRCDCNGWSCLNGAWNIFLYLTLFLLLTLGGVLLMSHSRAVPWRGSQSSSLVLWNWNNLHPFPLLSLPPACFLLQFLGCLSQLLKGCASLGEICLGCILQIPSSSQTNNQFLSSLGPLLAFFLLGTALSQEFRDSAVEILLIGSNVQNTGFKNQGSQVQCGCAC